MSEISGGFLFVYLIPTMMAFARGRKQAAAIAAVNVLLGWTVLGWIAAFVWALVEDRPAT